MSQGFTQEQKEKIRAMRRNSMTLDCIGREFGVSRERIRQIVSGKDYVPYCKLAYGDPVDGLEEIKAALDRLREEGREASLNDAERERIKRRYAEGLARVRPYATHLTMGAYLGIPSGQVRLIAKRAECVKMINAIVKEARGE